MEREHFSVLDQVESGFIFINEQGIIEIFNRFAKEITGIIHGSNYIHPSGTIEQGDIVIIADTKLGDDDGNLSPEDLSILGEQDHDLKIGNSVLVIASYNNKRIKPVYNILHNHHHTGEMFVETTIRKKKIHASIDFEERLVNIKIDHHDYPLNYLTGTGHIVILDKNNLKLKFVQAKGYSYRNEAIKELLQGATFLAKGQEEIQVDPIGEKAADIFGEGSFLDDIDSLIKDKEKSIQGKHYTIRGRKLLCSLNACQQGVSINLLDVSELGNLLKMRNELIEVIETNVAKVHQGESGTAEDYPNLQGSSPAMQEVKFYISKAAQVKTTVFLNGENGTGKTMVAREIHDAMDPTAPFIEVNCGSIPQSLFESELFGYKPGSFTGALKAGKEGFFQLAGSGTIFLDEITEIPPEVQVKLLHVLQDKRFYPIGANKPISMSARVIAATNRDIQEEINSKRFREDLFYRLNVFPISVPPLRQRLEDIYPLAQAFVSKLAREYNLKEKAISSSAYSKLLNYNWPGNVRELENVLERAVIICEGSTIYPEHLNMLEHPQRLHLSEIREAAEKKAIQAALLQTKDHNQLMGILGISKSSLYEKLKRYGLRL